MSDELMELICKRLDAIDKTLAEVEEHLGEIYKRTNMLLRVDEQAQESIVKLKTAQEELASAVNLLSDTTRNLMH